MSEHPILFKGPLVRSIIEGRKTVTRRIVRDVDFTTRPREWFHAAHVLNDPRDWLIEAVSAVWKLMTPSERPVLFRGRSPYGAAGDTLWVRETWAALGNEDGRPINEAGEVVPWGPGVACVYRADTSPGPYGCDLLPSGAEWHSKWRPSIFMPRWACRLLLDVVSVRIEKLSDITEEEVQREGVSALGWGVDVDDFIRRFKHLNVGRFHGDDPWVWRVEFKTSPGGAR